MTVRAEAVKSGAHFSARSWVGSGARDVGSCPVPRRRHQPTLAITLAEPSSKSAPIDGQRLEDVLVQHYDDLLQNLTRRVGCPDLAADALQDTWLRLAERRERTKAAHARAYVYRMACNRATDIIREYRRSRIEQVEDSIQWEDFPDLSPGPEHLVQVRHDLAEIIRQVECLPRRRQAICLDVWIDGSPQREVAQRFGVTVAAVLREVRAGRRSVCLSG